MSAEKDAYYDCSFVSIHYIICECGETFPSENGLKAHLEKEHPHKRERKEFKCGVCGLTYDSEDDCVAHYEEYHIAEVKQEDLSDEEIKPDTSQVATVTSEPMHEVTQELILEEHNYEEQILHEHNYEEQILHEHNYEEQNLHEHNYEEQNLHEDNYEEQTLQEQDYEEEILQQQDYDEQILQQQDFQEQTLHISEGYEQMVEVSNGQLVLLVNRDSKKKTPKNKNKKSSLKNIVCEVCGKKYASNAALKYHQRVHTGERPYKCHLCPKCFTMPLFLQIHVRTHTGERPYQCPECPKAFSNKAALLRHDRVHTGVKPYACPMCLKTFTQSNSMKLHVTTVHLKQPAPYKSKTRKMKAAERAKRAPPASEYETFTIKLEPDNNNGPSEDGDTNFEVIESEEVGVPDHEEVYEIVYDHEA